MTMFLTVFTFSIERFLTIRKANGNGSLESFLQKVKTSLHNNDINGAIAECNRQKGSVANVVVEGLHKYQEMEYSQIANALECSESAVKSLLFRAYETLRTRLAHLAP